jgi:hypothetical protein
VDRSTLPAMAPGDRSHRREEEDVEQETLELSAHCLHVVGSSPEHPNHLRISRAHISMRSRRAERCPPAKRYRIIRGIHSLVLIVREVVALAL